MHNTKTAKRVAAVLSDPAMFLKYAVYTQDETDKEHFGAKQFPYKEKAYLQDLAELWKYGTTHNRPIIIEKSRQLMVSWVFSALHLHEACTMPNRKHLILSKSESKAIEILKRLEYIYKNIPEEIWPAKLRYKMVRTKTKISFPEINSEIHSLTSNADSSRSITASRIFMDEFAFMADVDDLYQGTVGSTVGGGNLVIVSTNPILKNDSDCLFWKLRDDRNTELGPRVLPFDDIDIKCKKGLSVQDNSNGYLSVSLHYSADPERDPATKEGKAWYDTWRPRFPSKRRWDTEMELSRATYSGFGVFSDDFSEDLHVVQAEITPREGLPLLRGWDFAGNHSICIAQYIDGILYIIDELPNIGWHTRDVYPRVSEYCAQKYPGFTFLEIPDPSAFDKGRNDVDGESNIDRMVSLGVDRRKIIKVVTNRQEPRLDAVMKLLTTNVKGRPKLQIGVTCSMTITGLKGAYHFKEKLQANASRPTIVKNEYSHIIDALQYVSLFVGSGYTNRYLNRARSLRHGPTQDVPTYKL